MTTRGEIVIELRPDVAPWNVATIVALTQRDFYDGLAFHRVVPRLRRPGRRPDQSGYGGPGFTTAGRARNRLESRRIRGRAVIGIADAGRDSGGSQWFVMHSRAPHLDGRYTWIGAVRSGPEVRGCVADRRQGRHVEVRRSVEIAEPLRDPTVSRDAWQIDRARRVVRSNMHMRRSLLTGLVPAVSQPCLVALATPAPGEGDRRLRGRAHRASSCSAARSAARRPATATARVPDRLAHRGGRRRRARDRRRQRQADPHRPDRQERSRSSRSARTPACSRTIRSRKLAYVADRVGESHRGRQGRRDKLELDALDRDAGRAVRRRAVARSQDRDGHDDRRPRARRVRRRDRQGAVAHRARPRAARPRRVARRHARARRVPRDRHRRSDRSPRDPRRRARRAVDGERAAPLPPLRRQRRRQRSRAARSR